MRVEDHKDRRMHSEFEQSLERKSCETIVLKLVSRHLASNVRTNA